VPESLDPEYCKVEKEWFEDLFCKELDRQANKYPKLKSVKSILLTIKKKVTKDILYSMHDTLSFRIALQRASVFLAVSSLTALELKSYFPEQILMK
jgi:hypothetical protein